MKEEAFTEIIQSLAPNRSMRVAINYGNAVLAQKDSISGEPQGVSAQLAKKLAGRLDVEVKFITFAAAGKVVDALKDDVWDLAFLAIDPRRAAEICFTDPYIVIEGGYLVLADSTLQTVDDVDREGVRIAVGKNAAYDLFLSRTLQHAELVRAPTTPGAVDLFLEEGHEVAAGIKLQLLELAKSNPAVRVLDGHFMEIKQAMGVPKKGEPAKQYLNEFLKEMIENGFIRDELKKSGQNPQAVASI